MRPRLIQKAARFVFGAAAVTAATWLAPHAEAQSTSRNATPSAPAPALPSMAPSVETPVHGSEGPLRIHTQRASLQLIERASRVVELPDNITHVTDFDPQVITVDPISPTTVRVLAIAPGVTTIVFTDVHQVSRSVEVYVAGDTRHLEVQLEHLFPNADVEAIQVGQNVVLRGAVAEPSQISQIVDVAREFYPTVLNQMTVTTNDRIILHAKIAEINRSRLRQFGVNFTGFGNNGFLNNVTGGIAAANAVAGGSFFSLTEGTLPNPNLSFAFRTTSGEYGAFVEALKQEAVLRILAEPSVTVNSGRPAQLLSGGEFPILIPQGLGQTSIDFREFGISIEALAVVLGEGRIRLDIAPEVSDLDFTSGVTLDGIRIPGLTTRRVNTQAEMKFGETLVLGGLISNRRIGSTSKVPFLGELPYIGAAFSRKRYENAETELMIMVTPMPVAPYQPGEPLPALPGESTSDPTDNELIWHGQIELPKYGERCQGNCQPGMCQTGACGPGYGGPVVGGPVVNDFMTVPVTTTRSQVIPPMPSDSPAVLSVPSIDNSAPVHTTPYPVGEAIPMSPPAAEATPMSSTPAGSTLMDMPTDTGLQAPGVNQIGFQTEAMPQPTMTTPTATTPSTTTPVQTQPSTKSLRQRLNLFNRRSSDPLNAPQPSGPVTTPPTATGPTTTIVVPPSQSSTLPSTGSHPMTTDGLIKPTAF